MATSEIRYMKREEIERQADNVLQEHGQQSIPTDPVRLANEVGIKVNNAVFSSDAIAGMITKKGDSITLLVKQNDPPQRKRFTIAHELGHHFLHLLSGDEVGFVDEEDPQMVLFREDPGTLQEQDDIGDDSEEKRRKRQESQANMFAAALLMPEQAVRYFYEITPDPADLARQFNVSTAALKSRLRQLGLSDDK